MKTKTTKSASRTTSSQRKAVERHRLDPQMFIVPQVTDNPRRKNTFGHRSMSIVLSARKPITVEQFINKRGRLRDLHWDAQRGHVKLAKKAS